MVGLAKLVADYRNRGLAVIATALALSGCGLAPVPVAPATVDELRGPWRAEPLLVGPETRAQVDAACRTVPELPDDMIFVVVDARGDGRLVVGYANPAGSTAWLEATMGPEPPIECRIMSEAGGAILPLPERELRPASVGGSRDDGEGWWTHFSGSVGADITEVAAEVPGLPPVVGTLTDDGWFVLWWPEEGNPPFEFRIVGLGADGEEIADFELEHP